MPDDRSSLLINLAIKQPVASESATRYDEKLDELFVLHEDAWMPAADLPHGPPKTKKFDIEKGEDVKGRW